MVADVVREHHNLDEHFVVAAGEGVDVSARLDAPYEVPDDFLICPSTNHSHKNHALLFSALARAGLNDSDTHLVLTGCRYDDAKPLTDLAVECGLARTRVLDLEFVAEHGHVLDLISRSRAVVLPSLHEGWGLPALEGLAMGIPTVAHRLGGVPEFAGPGLKSPEFNSIDSWEAVLAAALNGDRVWFDAASRDSKRIQDQFTWARVAERITGAMADHLHFRAIQNSRTRLRVID